MASFAQIGAEGNRPDIRQNRKTEKIFDRAAGERPSLACADLSNSLRARNKCS